LEIKYNSLLLQKTDAGKWTPFWKTNTKNQEFKIDTDAEALRKYGELLNGSVAPADAFGQAMSGASDEAKNFAKSSDFASEKIAAFSASQKSAIKQTGVFKNAIGALKTAMLSIGSMLVNMVIMFAVSEGINLLIKGIDALIVTSEEAKEKVEELASAWKESDDKLSSHKKTLDGIAEEYATLSKGVDSLGRNVSLTSDEYERYKELANQIADMFPELRSGWTDEGDAILITKNSVSDLNDEIDRLIDKENQLRASKLGEVLSDFNTSYVGTDFWGNGKEQFQKTIIEDILNAIQSGTSASDLWSSWSGEQQNAATDVYKSAGYDVGPWGGLNDYFKAAKNDPNMLRAYYDQVISAMSSGVYNAQESILSTLASSDIYDQLSAESKTLINTFVSNLDSDFVAAFASQPNPGLALRDWITEDLLTPFAEFDFSKIIGAKSLFDTSKISVADYDKLYQEFLDSISGFTPEIQQALTDTFSPNVNNLIANVEGKLAWDSGSLDDVDIAKTLSLEDLQIAANLEVPKDTLYSWDELLQKIAEVKDAESYAVDSIKTSLDSLTAQSTTLASAIDEQSQSGSVSYKTYQELIDANSEYADSFSVVDGRLRINAESAYALAEANKELALSEAEAGMAAKQAQIDENQAALADINKQIDAMEGTGAYFSSDYDALVSQRDILLSTNDTLALEYQQYQAITTQIKSMGSVHAQVFDSIVEQYDTLLSVTNSALQSEEARIDLLKAQGKQVTESDYTGLLFSKKSEIYNLEKELGLLQDEFFKLSYPIGSEAWSSYEQKIKDVEIALTQANAELIAYQDTVRELGITKLQFEMSGLGEQESQIKRALETMESSGAAGTLELYTSLIDIGDQQIENLSKQNEALEEQLDGLDPLSEKYQEIGDQINANRDSIYEVRKSQEEWNDSIANLPVAKIKLAEETANAGDNYESLADVSKTLKESAKSGKIVNDDIQSVVDFMLGGSSAEMSYEEQMKRVKEAQKKYARYFTEDNKGVINFSNDLLKKGLVTNDNGKITLGEGVTGETLMKTLGLSKDAIVTMFKNLEEYGGEFDWGALFPEMTQEEIDALEDQPSVIDQEAQRLVEDAGLYGEYADEAVKAIANANRRIADALSGKTPIQPTQPTSGTSLFSAGQPNESPAPTQTQEQSQGVDVAVDITMTEEDAATLAALHDVTGKTLVISAEASLEDAQLAINTLGDNVDNIIIDVTADTAEALNQANLLKDAIEALRPTVWVTVKKTAGSAYASGTKKARDGSALVGERGRELVETNGGYMVVDEPTIIPLNEGDRVHNNADTEKILRRSSTSSSKSGQAFETGTWNLPSASSSSASRSSSSSTSWKKYFEQLFDWIEIRLEKLSKITDKWTDQIKKAIGYFNQNKVVDSAITSIGDQIKALREAYGKYLGIADAVAKKSGLSKGIIKAIQNGTMDITLYDKTTQEKIQEYQKWYEQAQDVKDAIADLEDQQAELNAQKLDNISQQYENLQGVIDNTSEAAQSIIDLKIAQGQEVSAGDYGTLIDAKTEEIARLREEQQALLDEFNAQVASGALVEGSDTWYEYKNNIDELDAAILDANKDLVELNDTVNELSITKLGYQLAELAEQEAVIQRQLDLIDGQGGTATDGLYNGLIAIGNQQVQNYNDQNEALRAQLVGLDPLSEKYQEINDQINSNKESINDIMVSQEQWNDAVIDLKIDELQKAKDALSEANDEYQRQFELQQAIEDLERAKSQRKIRILENGEFKYISDVKDVAEKQRALDQKRHEETMAKFDKEIELLEKSKATNNVYETLGLTQADMQSLVSKISSDDFINSLTGSANLISTSLSEWMGKIGTTSVAPISNTTNTGGTIIQMEAGAIVIHAQSADANEVFNTFNAQLPNAFEQILHKK